MVPSHVRIFWWLSVALVAYWVLSAVWFLEFPTNHYLAVLAKLPAAHREYVRRADLQNMLIWTSILVGVTLALAWFAMFRHANWSRWAFAALFIMRESIPFLIYVAYYHRLDLFREELARENWTDPLGYVDAALSIAAILFVFSGNARGWFRTPAASSNPRHTIAPG